MTNDEESEEEIEEEILDVPDKESIALIKKARFIMEVERTLHQHSTI